MEKQMIFAIFVAAIGVIFVLSGAILLVYGDYKALGLALIVLGGLIFWLGLRLQSREHKEKPILRATNRILVVGPVDGTRTIVKAKEVGIFQEADDSFVEINRPGKPTPRAQTRLFELNRPATLRQMFLALPVDIPQALLTQHQFSEICWNHAEDLGQDEYTTFALIRKDEDLPPMEDNLLVLSVNINGTGRTAYQHEFADEDIWEGVGQTYILAKLSDIPEYVKT